MSPDLAPVFAALGDPTRLALIGRLGAGPLSITELADGLPLTRQAVAKHLTVMRGAGLVEQSRAGREARVSLRPEALLAARDHLALAAAQWDSTLDRLKRLAED
ncbi:metalloregulator ArsR/SmtB family transcription factor [Cereibacter sp. SYSU M97828]|nr:metalloregulator ArsR/SmtB family transcription factor [Cereibacter flavus]